MDDLDPELVEKAMHARVPGGSEVWVWLPQKDAFTPSETAWDVMFAALSAILPDLRAKHYAEALDMAAKVAEGYNRWDYVQMESTGEWSPGSPWDRGKQRAAEEITTTIRALKDAPHG